MAVPPAADTLYFGEGDAPDGGGFSDGWGLYTDSGLTTEYTGNSGNWTASEGTLNLNGFSYITTAATALRTVTDTTINVENTNTITSMYDNAGASDSYGIYAAYNTAVKTLTFTGTGSLTATSGNASARSSAIRAGGMTIDSLTLTAKSGTGNESFGLDAYMYPLTMKNAATIHAEAGAGTTESRGMTAQYIYSSGASSTLTAKGTAASSGTPDTHSAARVSNQPENMTATGTINGSDSPLVTATWTSESGSCVYKISGTPALYVKVVSDPTYSVALTVNKDGAAYASHGKTFTLRKSGLTITGTGAGGTVSFDGLVNGEYALRDGSTNTGITIIVSDGNAVGTVDYYTVEFDVADDAGGASSGSGISAKYDSTAIASGDVVLGGKALVVTAASNGASSYTYAWSGAGTNSETTVALSIATLGEKVDALCTVTGAIGNITLYFGNDTANGGGWGLYATRNGNNDFSDEYPGRGVTWTASANTLNLIDFSYTTMASVALNLVTGSTIMLSGTNTITSTAITGPVSQGIYVMGTLTIDAVDANAKLTATGGKSTTGASYGIYTYAALTISGGTVEGIAGESATSDGANGVCSNSSGTALLVKSGATLIGKGGTGNWANSQSNGVVSKNTITIEIGGVVEGTAGTGGDAGLNTGVFVDSAGTLPTTAIGGDSSTSTETLTYVDGVYKKDGGTGARATYVKIAPETNAVTLTVNKDGSAYASHGKTFTLQQSGAVKYTGVGTDGAVKFSGVVDGVYDLFDGSTDTGIDTTMTGGTNVIQTLNYYTVKFKATDAGTASGSSVSATYDSIAITNDTVVLGGKTLVMTATGAGASSYTYLWGGTGFVDNGTNAVKTINDLAAAIDAECTVTGTTSGYTITLNGGGGIITGATTVTTGADGKLASLPNAPMNPPGAIVTFSGWFTASSGGTQITTSYEFTQNTTIYAQWAPVGTAPSITTNSLPRATVGEAYAASLTAGGTTPFTWSINVGSLPAGLTINPATGIITGTPTTGGTVTFTAKVTNSVGSATKEFSIIVGSTTAVTKVAVTPASAIVLQGKTQTFTATVSGTGSYSKAVTWSVSGNKSKSTKINTSGKLTVAKDETANTLTVRVVSNGDSTKSATAKVRVAFKNGTKFTSGNYTYVITNDKTNGSGTVRLTGVAKSKAKTLTKVNIPATASKNGIKYKVTVVGSKAFYKNTKITSATISNNVKTIANSVFSGCSNLKTVKIGDKVTSIGAHAFYKCTKLKTVTIGTGLKTIKKHAFCHDTKLKTITIKSTNLKTVEKHAFYNMHNVKVKVPSKKLSAYKKILKDNTEKSNIKIVKI